MYRGNIFFSNNPWHNKVSTVTDCACIVYPLCSVQSAASKGLYIVLYVCSYYKLNRSVRRSYFTSHLQCKTDKFFFFYFTMQNDIYNEDNVPFNNILTTVLHTMQNSILWQGRLPFPSSIRWTDLSRTARYVAKGRQESESIHISSLHSYI